MKILTKISYFDNNRPCVYSPFCSNICIHIFRFFLCSYMVKNQTESENINKNSYFDNNWSCLHPSVQICIHTYYICIYLRPHVLMSPSLLWGARVRHHAFCRVQSLEPACVLCAFIGYRYSHPITVINNLVGGTETHKFHTCIHRTLRSWKNIMCVRNFILFFYCSKSHIADPLKLIHRSAGVRSNPG